MKHNNHVWSFSTVGGVKRVNLETAGDLEHLGQLDPKLWTALSCPVNDLEIDNKTLGLIDADKDGQIRVPEVIAAVDWVCSVLKDPGTLLKQEAVFHLSSINESTEQGKILLDSAKVILKNLGKDDAATLTVEETSDTEKIFAGTRFNGDGIITEDTTTDAALLALLNEVMAHAGAATDRGGKQGITLDLLLSFLDEAEKFSAWYARKDAAPSIAPLGDNTAAAYENFCNIRPKVDDYFIRCRLAAFDTQSTDVLNLQVARVELITDKDLSQQMEEIAAYPLAKIEPNKPLPLLSGINPAWESAIKTFKELTADHLATHRDHLSEADWHKISGEFAAFAQWMSEKEGLGVEALGLARVREILSGTAKDELISLIEQDKALEDEANNIIEVDKLVRYHRDLFKLLKNFVTFYDFYSHDEKAIFQAGTLYIDQRSCDLCIKVHDMPKHAAQDIFSGIYLLYCDCVSKSTKEKMTIVAGLTNGDVDDLVVGRNALFYDRSGMDWDATVVKIVENPISIRQAFFSPYRKVSRFIETRMNKFAAAQDEKATGNLTSGVDNIPVKEDDAKVKKDAPPPFDVGKFVGIFAAIGLAVGAIGTALAAALGGFMKLAWWKMPLAFLGIIMLISGPSMLIAYLKLRKRNLAPILDANGWAVNARVIINIQFGRTLTHLATFPKGAKINFNDPFTKKKFPFIPFIIVLLVLTGGVLYLLQKYGWIHIRLNGIAA